MTGNVTNSAFTQDEIAAIAIDLLARDASLEHQPGFLADRALEISARESSEDSV